MQLNPCLVCAKGATLMSLVANFNNATVSKADSFGGMHYELEKLGFGDVFPRDLWRAIELAFDQRDAGNQLHPNWSLATVMKWLIKHKGSFPYGKRIYSDGPPVDASEVKAPFCEPEID